MTLRESLRMVNANEAITKLEQRFMNTALDGPALDDHGMSILWTLFEWDETPEGTHYWLAVAEEIDVMRARADTFTRGASIYDAG